LSKLIVTKGSLILKMIIETIKLNEMSVFTEFFLGISIMYLIIHCLFISVNSQYGFPLLQSSLINLSILTVFMSCCLLWNDCLASLRYVSFSNTIVNDYLSFSSKFIIGVSSLICLLLIKQYLIAQKINSFEYIIILLFAVLGLFLLCSSNDLMTTYLAIELQSLSFYLLTAFKKNSSYSVESGLKYFILGSFSSGLFLFGSSLIYGALGTVNFTELRDLHIFYGNDNFLRSIIEPNSLDVLFYNPIASINYTIFLDTENFLIIGLLFIYVSLFFKLALAPFHLWSPDIYENSPTSSAFFFAIVPKISIFIVILRFSSSVLITDLSWSKGIVSLIAVLSVVVGSLGGLEQRKFKSLLAYSSVSHMGYLLISYVSESFDGFQMLFCYLIIYISSGLCLWSVFMFLRIKKTNEKKQNRDLADFVLLAKSNKILAIILMTALLSIAGVPPMVGFLAKLNILLAIVKKSMYFIAFFILLFSVVSTFFYLRIVKILFFEPSLVGKLYFPITSRKVVIVVILFYFFIFSFINPTMLYLVTYKMSLLFIV
jgi:NADH-quinone oxidoreductase subunit N